jgi:hypothetical protein
MAGTTAGPAKGRGGRQLQARDRARERATQFVAREARLQELAAGYFVLQDNVADARAGAEERIARIRAELEQALRVHQDNADLVVVQMLETGVSGAETAQRLGITPGAVRRIKASFDADAAAVARATEAELATEAAGTLSPGSAV